MAKGCSRTWLASEGLLWEDVARFVKQQYPSFPLGLKPEDTDTVGYIVDASKAERELGVHYKGMEQQVRDVVDQQLELRKGSV